MSRKSVIVRLTPQEAMHVWESVDGWLDAGSSPGEGLELDERESLRSLKQQISGQIFRKRRRRAPCDRSGEAVETSGLDPQDESAVTGSAGQAPSDNPLTETKEGSEHVRWPTGCIKPSSCARHKQCMYAQSPQQCRHLGKNLSAEIEEASHAR